MNLRERVEQDLSRTLEGEFALPVILTDPSGVTYDKSALDATKDLVGQVMYTTTEINPSAGTEVVVDKPVVSIRIRSLTRVPLKGEKNWLVQIPKEPKYDADKKAYHLELPTKNGASIGFIRLYLTDAIQS
jgi:hypothetical protein